MVSAQRKMSAEEYIDLYKDIAIEQMKEYRIPASIKLAQGMLESGNGYSRLAVKANNHFGIKCKTTWKGDRIYHDDDQKGECFRSYRSARESYVDHSIFLSTQPRYASLFKLDITDYKGWAHGLKSCGYATHPDYAEMLIRLIESYDLYKFDAAGRNKSEYAEIPTGILGREKNEKDREEKHTGQGFQREWGNNNGVKYIIIRAGDNFRAVAKEAGISPRKLMTFNDLGSEQLPEEGRILYVSKKKKTSATEFNHHVQAGETTYSISQKYGITIRELKKMNPQLDAGPAYVGQKLRLR